MLVMPGRHQLNEPFVAVHELYDRHLLAHERVNIVHLLRCGLLLKRGT